MRSRDQPHTRPWVLCGTDDPDVLPADADKRRYAQLVEAANAMAKLDHPCQLILYDDGCHVRHLSDGEWQYVDRALELLNIEAVMEGKY